jgi:hypothetical protein
MKKVILGIGLGAVLGFVSTGAVAESTNPLYQQQFFSLRLCGKLRS